jgi:hypothetical protein
MVCVALCNACSTVVFAQTLTIRLVNAETGKPVQNKHVSVSLDDEFSIRRDLPLSDKDGIVHVSVPPNVQFITLHSGPKIGKDPDRIPYGVCGKYSQLQIEDIVKHGFVPQNQCEPKVKLQAKSGEIVYLVQLIPRWAPDFQ